MILAELADKLEVVATAAKDIKDLDTAIDITQTKIEEATREVGDEAHAAIDGRRAALETLQRTTARGAEENRKNAALMTAAAANVADHGAMFAGLREEINRLRALQNTSQSGNVERLEDRTQDLETALAALHTAVAEKVEGQQAELYATSAAAGPAVVRPNATAGPPGPSHQRIPGTPGPGPAGRRGRTEGAGPHPTPRPSAQTAIGQRTQVRGSAGPAPAPPRRDVEEEAGEEEEDHNGSAYDDDCDNDNLLYNPRRPATTGRAELEQLQRIFWKVSRPRAGQLFRSDPQASSNRPTGSEGAH